MIGTRPEAIKLAPVAHALDERGSKPSIILSGQHPKLHLEDFGLQDFGVECLECPGQEDPHRHVRAVTAALLPRLASAPDLIVVQGDTSSALGAALAGFTAAVPVAHVEAGLRSNDPLLPWPEEEYRIAIDAGAALLFAPTETSAQNLRAEGLPGEIHITGNTSIDAVLALEATLPSPRRRTNGRPLLLVTAHRRESWSEGLSSIATALRILALEADIDFILHPNPHVAATMEELLAGSDGIHLLPPCGHRELIQRIREADLVLSDSGGIQEEAPALGVPLLVLREKTERPEGITAGGARLVGTSAERIVSEARRLFGDRAALEAMCGRRFPYGDGRAAARIAEIIADWLEKRAALSPPTQERALGPWR